MMKKTLLLLLISCSVGLVNAQEVLTLDQCRKLAIENNKQLKIADEKIKAAEYNKKSARANYLPALDATGAYMYNSRNISVLGEDKHLPVGALDQNGNFTFRPDQIVIGPDGKPVIGPNGKPIPKNWALIPESEFVIDIKNVFVGAVTLTQPIYMGGKIRAYNNITKYAEELARTQKDMAVKDLVFKVDEIYWQAISLSYKKSLAEGYLKLLEKLNSDIEIMISEGVATKSEGLTVAVKLNEAQITLNKVDNGLRLTKMQLAQYCGIELEKEFNLTDEDNIIPKNDLLVSASVNMDDIFSKRNEIKALYWADKIYKSKEKIVLSEMLPHLALTGSYAVTNPNGFNGIHNNFAGMFNVGVALKVPILHWGKEYNKLRAAKVETKIAQYEQDEAREKIELQVNQALFKSNEATRKLDMTLKNMEKADENLRVAQTGFEEGVLTTQNVLEAQTAWLMAKSEKIDAEVDLKLCKVYLNKALGNEF